LKKSRHASAPSQASAALRFKLQGANPAPKLAGLDELPGKSHYLIGNDPKQWRKNVANYAKVAYDEVYPGIDLVYYGNQRQLEYDFIVAPGADPKAIRLAIEGASRAAINAAGDLVLTTPNGEIRQHKPIVYQDIDGQRHPLEGRYVLSTRSPDAAQRNPGSSDAAQRNPGSSDAAQRNPGSSDAAQRNPRRSSLAHRKAHDATQIAFVGFEVDDYDRSRPLVIRVAPDDNPMILRDF
jgi:hypothetical protein